MTFYPKAEWQSGPANKQNGGTNGCKGVVCHSMVGPYRAAFGELVKPSRRASWHYSVLQDGRVIVHYPDEAQTWHAGSARNNDTIGIEHEGGFSPHNEPLTPKQLAASVDLVRWLSKTHGFPMTRGVGLLEHNEVSGEPTACPSRRIPWAEYTEEDHMDCPTKAEFAELFKYMQRVDAAVKFLIETTVALSMQVYGDTDPKTIELAQRVKALEAADK